MSKSRRMKQGSLGGNRGFAGPCVYGLLGNSIDLRINCRHGRKGCPWRLCSAFINPFRHVLRHRPVFRQAVEQMVGVLGLEQQLRLAGRTNPSRTVWSSHARRASKYPRRSGGRWAWNAGRRSGRGGYSEQLVTCPIASWQRDEGIRQVGHESLAAYRFQASNILLNLRRIQNLRHCMDCTECTFWHGFQGIPCRFRAFSPLMADLPCIAELLGYNCSMKSICVFCGPTARACVPHLRGKRPARSGGS